MTKLFSLVGIALTLSSCAVLNAPLQPIALTQTAQPVKNNLIGLFMVKRNNLNQQYRAEIYPIARYSNGRYTDASIDVTLDVRQNAKEADIVKRNAARSLLKPNSMFTVVDQLNQVNVERLGVSRFACSSVLVGRSKVAGQQNLPAMFNQLPRDRERSASGIFDGEKFEETWRSTIAAQSTTPAAQIRPTPAQLEQYRKDLIRIGTSEIAKHPQAKSVQGSIALTELRVFDLDRDGKPEVFGKLRKAPAKSGATTPNRPTAIYANLWLGYTTPQPQPLASQVVPYFVPVADLGRIYEVIGTIDVDGDGKQEVLIQNNGYEAISFSIHQLQGKQLKSVFTGAGYGC